MRGSTAVVDKIYTYALKLLAGRDYTVSRLRARLETRFGAVPEEVIEWLLQKKFLDDRRYAENYVSNKKRRGRERLRAELNARGVPASVVEEVLSKTVLPSLKEALEATMIDWKLSAPLEKRDAARLFRALARGGYEEDAIREVIEELHDQ